MYDFFDFRDLPIRAENAGFYPIFQGIQGIHGTGRHPQSRQNFDLIPFEGADLGINSLNVDQDHPRLPAQDYPQNRQQNLDQVVRCWVLDSH